MSNNQNNSNNNQIQIDLPEDVAYGEYTNLVLVAHSPNEFVLDFICLLPGNPKAKVKSRIVLTPENAKRLLLTLNDNISNFEKQNGKIVLPEVNDPLVDNIDGVVAEA